MNENIKGNIIFICKFCSRECKNTNALRNHERLCIENPNRQQSSRGMLGKSSWNKGLISKTDERVFQNRESQRKQRKEHGSNWYGRKHSEKTKNLMSIKACKRLAKHSKYSINVEYRPKTILESSYEVKTAKLLDELNIEWVKVRMGYVWDDNGKQRRYIPDFYLPKYDVFLDPKNDYLIKKDKRKIESAMQLNNITVIVINKDQLTLEFFNSLFSCNAAG